MEYRDLERIFRKHEALAPKFHLDGLITFADLGTCEDPSYTQLDRTYLVSSDNKAFQARRLGYSVFGTCLNGKDLSVRLDAYMRRANGWVPGECALLLYQLQSINEREIMEPGLYMSKQEAQEAMLESMCRQGNLEYSEVLATYHENNGWLGTTSYGAGRDCAWLNDSSSGSWDWAIHAIRIYDLTKIEIGRLYISPAANPGFTTSPDMDQREFGGN